MAVLNPQLQAFRDCYAACRAAGGTIQVCQEQCNQLAGTNRCDPCCGFWECFGRENLQTLQTVTGAVVKYGPIAAGLSGIGIAVGAIIVLMVVLRR